MAAHEPTRPPLIGPPEPPPGPPEPRREEISRPRATPLHESELHRTPGLVEQAKNWIESLRNEPIETLQQATRAAGEAVLPETQREEAQRLHPEQQPPPPDYRPTTILQRAIGEAAAIGPGLSTLIGETARRIPAALPDLTTRMGTPAQEAEERAKRQIARQELAGLVTGAGKGFVESMKHTYGVLLGNPQETVAQATEHPLEFIANVGIGPGFIKSLGEKAGALATGLETGRAARAGEMATQLGIRADQVKIHPGRMEITAHVVDQTAKALTDPKPVLEGIRAGVNKLRAQDQGLDAALKQVDAFIDEHIDPRIEAAEYAQRARQHRQAVVEEGFRWRRRLKKETAEAFGDLTGQERSHFYRYVAGLEEMPDNPSPALDTAYKWWASHSAQWQLAWMEAERLTPETAWMRRYQPLRIEKYGFEGEEGEAALQALRRKEAFRGINREAIRTMRGQDRVDKLIGLFQKNQKWKGGPRASQPPTAQFDWARAPELTPEGEWLRDQWLRAAHAEGSPVTKQEAHYVAAALDPVAKTIAARLGISPSEWYAKAFYGATAGWADLGEGKVLTQDFLAPAESYYSRLRETVKGAPELAKPQSAETVARLMGKGGKLAQRYSQDEYGFSGLKFWVESRHAAERGVKALNKLMPRMTRELTSKGMTEESARAVIANYVTARTEKIAAEDVGVDLFQRAMLATLAPETVTALNELVDDLRHGTFGHVDVAPIGPYITENGEIKAPPPITRDDLNAFMDKYPLSLKDIIESGTLTDEGTVNASLYNAARGDAAKTEIEVGQRRQIYDRIATKFDEHAPQIATYLRQAGVLGADQMPNAADIRMLTAQIANGWSDANSRYQLLATYPWMADMADELTQLTAPLSGGNASDALRRYQDAMNAAPHWSQAGPWIRSGYTVGGGMAYALRMTQFMRNKSAAKAILDTFSKTMRIDAATLNALKLADVSTYTKVARAQSRENFIRAAQAADATLEQASGHWERRGKDVLAHERFSVYPSKSGDQVYVSQELQWDPWEAKQRVKATDTRDYGKMWDMIRKKDELEKLSPSYSNRPELDEQIDKLDSAINAMASRQAPYLPWFSRGGGPGVDMSLYRMLNTAQRLGTRKIGILPGIVNAIRNNHVSANVKWLDVIPVAEQGGTLVPGMGTVEELNGRKLKPGEIVVVANSSGGPIEAPGRGGAGPQAYDLDRLTMAIEHPADRLLPNLDTAAGERYFEYVKNFGSEWSQRIYARFTTKMERKYGADWIDRMEQDEKETAAHLKDIVPTWGPTEALQALAKKRKEGWEGRLTGALKEDYEMLQAAKVRQEELATAARYSKVHARRLAEEIMAKARAKSPEVTQEEAMQRVMDQHGWDYYNYWGNNPYFAKWRLLSTAEQDAIKASYEDRYGRPLPTFEVPPQQGEGSFQTELRRYIGGERYFGNPEATAASKRLIKLTRELISGGPTAGNVKRIDLPVELPYFGGTGSKLNYDVDMLNRTVARVRDLLRAKGYKNEERIKSLTWQPETIDITVPQRAATTSKSFTYPAFTPEYMAQLEDAAQRWHRAGHGPDPAETVGLMRRWMDEEHETPDQAMTHLHPQDLWAVGAREYQVPADAVTQYMEVPILELSHDELQHFSSVPLLKKARGGGIKGAAEQLQDSRWVIRAFGASDVTTFAHEIAHVVRNKLSPDLQADLDRVFNIRDGVWTVSDEEKFARSWERFLMDGRAPDPSMFEVFRQLSEWIGKIYSGGFGLSDAAIAPPLRKFFHTLMGFDSDPNTLGVQPYPLEKLFSYSELGPALKSRRERFGMTEEEVAARAGIPVERVRQLEGTGKGSRREKRGMAAALRLEAKSVLKYKPQETPKFKAPAGWEKWEPRPYTAPTRGFTYPHEREAGGTPQAGDLATRARALGLSDKDLASATGSHPVSVRMVLDGTIAAGPTVDRIRRVIEEEEKLQAPEPTMSSGVVDEATLTRLRELGWSEEDIARVRSGGVARTREPEPEGGGAGEAPGGGGPLLQETTTTRDRAAEFVKALQPGSALHLLADRTHQLSEDMAAQGKQAPMYWPFIRKSKPSDFFPSPIDQTRRVRPKSMKLSTGTTYVNGSFVKDPQEVAFRHYLEIMRYISTERLISNVMNDEKIPKRIYQGEPLAPNEELFAPDGFIQLYRRAIDFGDDIIEHLDRYGLADDAAAQALRDAAARGDFSTTAAGVKKAQVYVMPKSVMKELRSQWTPAPKWIRLLVDRPTDWWVTATLALRPAWVVNNTVGGVIFSLLGGTLPQDYIRAMLPEFMAKTPEEAGGGLAGAFTTQAGEYTHLGRHADTTLGSIISYLESLPPQRQIGQVADHVLAFNSGIESFFRRANFIHHADKAARLAYMRRTGDAFFRAYKLLDEMDTLTPDEVKGAVDATNRFMGDYANLRPWERQWFRRLVRFYSFMKHQTLLLMGMPLYAPGRFAMIHNLNNVAQDMAEQDSAPLPEYLQGKGLIDTGVSITAGDPPRPLRVFANTQGWNPLVMGFATGSEGVRDITDIPRLIASQGSPLTQYMATTLTRRTSMGQPYTEPGTVEVDGRFWRRAEDLKGYTGQVKKLHPQEGVAEVEPPIPSPWEFYAGSFPQVQLARRMINPNAGFTAEPFSTETPRAGGVTERTRLTELLKYFGASFVLVDTTQARALPISRSTMRAIVRRMAKQEAARGKR